MKSKNTKFHLQFQCKYYMIALEIVQKKHLYHSGVIILATFSAALNCVSKGRVTLVANR